MDRRLSKILSSKKSASSVDQNSYINIAINNDERLLPPSEINKVINISDQFNIERQDCPFYRIFGKITTLSSNVLFNINGKYPRQTVGGSIVQTTSAGGGYEAFDDPKLKSNPDPNADTSLWTYKESFSNRLKIVNGWYGYFEPDLNKSGFCNFYEMTPNSDYFSLIPNQILGLKNWDITITYPYASDKTHLLVNNGITIVSQEQITVGGKQMITLGVPVKHNLNVGDIVRIKNTNINGDYEVKAIGKNNGDLKKYFFAIDAPNITLNNSNINSFSRFSKIYNNVESDYYFRKFKETKTKITPKLDGSYDVSNLGFSLSLFDENIVGFNLNEDIDVSDLTDNLGRPLSELYLTIIKTDSSNMFSKVNSGIEAPLIQDLNITTSPLIRDIPLVQKFHNVPAWPTQTYTPLESDVKLTNPDFYGDVVEYNKTTLEEIVLSDIYYRFNTQNRETSNLIIGGGVGPLGPRPEGYYYKAHQLIRIRDFSSYIEEGDSNTVDIPSYAEQITPGRFIWRDLLEIGGTDITKNVVNYPFANGYHNIYNDIVFGIKRQDPFDNWDLYYSTYPSDPPGCRMSNKFKVNVANNDC